MIRNGFKLQLILFFAAVSIFADDTAGIVYRDTIPIWLVPLRDAVYEQILTADEVYPIYEKAKTKALSDTNGAAQFYLLARCEYFMGRVYQYYKLNDSALKHYESCYDYAEKSLANAETSQGWEMYGAAVAQLCTVKPKSWLIQNGTRTEKYAKVALKLEPRNAHAQFLIASRWVYAPWPLNKTEKGIEMMKKILTDADMQKDDLFNVYTALAFGYLRDNKNSAAEKWIDLALTIYPTNKIVGVEFKKRIGK